MGPPDRSGYGHNFPVLGGGWWSAKPLGVGYKFPDGTPVNFSTPLAAVARPAETIAVACATWYDKKGDVLDTSVGWDALYPPGWKETVQPWGCVSGRHGGGANCLFVDGHVRWLRREQAYTPELFGL